jgi:hypothetical protein
MNFSGRIKPPKAPNSPKRRENLKRARQFAMNLYHGDRSDLFGEFGEFCG